MTLLAPSSGSPPPVPRRHERKTTLLAAKIRTAQGTDDCVVHDLSAGGAEISSVATLVASQKVSLLLPRVGWVDGRVAWCGERRIGIEFLVDLAAVALYDLMAPASKPAAALPGDSSSSEMPASRPDVPETDDPAQVQAGERVRLEARLAEVARDLDDRALEVAIDQVALLARLGR